MKTLKKFKLINVLLIAFLVVSCSNDDSVVVIPPTQSQSMTAANFESLTSYSDNGYTNIQFGDITNNFFQSIIKVHDYNTDYNYSIKIKGDYLLNEYEVDLVFDEIDEDGATILRFNKADFNAVPDTYQAYIIEEESNTELWIVNKPDQGTRPYFIYDADHAEYLYALFFKTDGTDYTIPTSINNSGTCYVTYPSVGNFSSGLTLEVVVFDTNLNELGRVNITGSLGYTKTFNGSDLDFISTSGDYIFQLQGTPTDPNSNYTARQSTYQTMAVNVN
mgnify:CR=1 FL=1|tara:strand:- start:1103 stop:1930 length:828 start_codon:yes stop_codon:yes gene_type:complete